MLYPETRKTRQIISAKTRTTCKSIVSDELHQIRVAMCIYDVPEKNPDSKREALNKKRKSNNSITDAAIGLH